MVIAKDEFAWDDEDKSFEFRDLRFVTVHGGGQWTPGEDSFHFFKTRALVDQYLDYFARSAEFPVVDNLLELGLFDGGSVPFWAEIFDPEHQAGLDKGLDKPNPYLDRYLERTGRRDRVSLYWGTDQTDAAALDEICSDAFGGSPLDLVIDDASHFYPHTRRSFELLFPRVRPGGLYIIEDWAWFHWHGTEEEWCDKEPLTRLIHEIIEIAGSTSNRLILSVDVCSGFAVVRRGWTPSEELKDFSVESAIYRHPR